MPPRTPRSSTTGGDPPKGRPAHQLVGRADVLRTGRVALEGPGVVVCGPPGSGTSAVAAALAPRPAARVVATPATSGQPLWLVRSVAPGCAVDPNDAPHATAVLVSALGTGSGGRAPILAVEDLDRLDEPSQAALLHAVASGAVRVVGTRRGGGPAPGGISGLWRELGVVRVDLGPLADAAAVDLVRQRLDGPVEGRTLTTLVAMASGNPGLLVDLVDTSVAEGVLEARDGLWRLVGEPPLSPALADRAALAVEGLDRDAHDALDLMVVAGRIPLDLATRATSAGALEQLERRQLVRVDGTDGAVPTIAVTDAVVAAHRVRTMPVLTRRRVAGRLADAAGTTPDGAWPGRPAGGATGAPSGLPTRQLATTVWALEAGRLLDGPRLLDAARAAIDAGDTVLGERLAAASLAVEATTEAVLLESWCADQRGDESRVTALLDTHEPVDAEAAVAVLIRRAEQRFWTHRDERSALELLTSVDVGEPWTLAARAQIGVFDLLAGRVDAVLADASPLVDHPEPLVGSTAALATALALVVADRPLEAERLARAALDRLDGPTPALYIDPGVHVISLAFALHGAGRLTEADDLTSAVYQHALSRPGHQAQGWAALIRSQVLRSLGRTQEALVVALEAELIWTEACFEGLARWCAITAAQAAAELGDRDALAAALTRADALRGAPFTLFDPERTRAEGWARFLAGDAEEAARLLESAADEAVRSGRLGLAALAAHDLIRFGDGERALSLLAPMADPARSPVTAAWASLAEAAAIGDPEGLVGAADRFAAMGATGWAAEALAMAASERPARAPALKARVRELLGDDAPRTPPLHALRDTDATVLTRREEEVVALAARGLSNRSIADELTVSLRTVENHLHRAFAKLGINSRAELTADR